MSYMCPVCNGLTSLSSHCPNCYHQLDDFGRLDAMWGPYSPYSEIDHLKQSNGFNDYEQHKCIHVGVCPSCGSDQLIFVDEKYTI